jgi:hypothetical protein
VREIYPIYSPSLRGLGGGSNYYFTLFPHPFVPLSEGDLSYLFPLFEGVRGRF